MLLLSFLSLMGYALAYTETQADFIMYKNIDPIKFPGSYDKSHQHIFFGSDAITADTTTSDELRKGCTTASNTNDFSTYWTPTLLYTGGSSPSPIIPARFNAYYENEQYAEIPFPDNLKMIAGNPDATEEDQMSSSADAAWYCDGTQADDEKINGFPASTCDSYLHNLLYYPDCVDTSTLAYAYSSSTYGNTNYCPDGYNRITRLRFSIRYTLQGIVPDWSNGAPLDISSSNNTGTTWSSHGDFFNGWDPEAAKNMLSFGGSDFSFVSGSISNGNTPNDCTASDAEPNLGTSDYETAYDLQHGLTSYPGGGGDTSGVSTGAAAGTTSMAAATSAAASGGMSTASAASSAAAASASGSSSAAAASGSAPATYSAAEPSSAESTASMMSTAAAVSAESTMMTKYKAPAPTCG